MYIILQLIIPDKSIAFIRDTRNSNFHVAFCLFQRINVREKQICISWIIQDIPFYCDMLTQGKQNAISNGKISNYTTSVCALHKCLHSWKH